MSANTNRDRVARAFLAGNTGVTRSGAMIAIGDRVYSYAHQLATAYPSPSPRDPAYVVIDQSCDRCHSRTTATHAAALRRALDAAGWQLERTSTHGDIWTRPPD
jgi:hypothetical protein